MEATSPTSPTEPLEDGLSRVRHLRAIHRARAAFDTRVAYGGSVSKEARIKPRARGFQRTRILGYGYSVQE
jgi:hypothetical protein